MTDPSDPYRQSLIEGERLGARYALAVRHNAPLGVAGIQLGNRAGSSLEFMDHREYQPGDDPRRIDWSAAARTDRLIVKLYREEVSPHLDLLVDGSRSMALAGTAKAGATVTVASLLATAAGSSGYSHCAWITGGGSRRIEGGTLRPSAWRGIAFDDTHSPAESLARLPPAWRRKGIRILVSDLMWMGDPQAMLSRLAAGASAVVIVQVLAQADLDPPTPGNVRLVDSETGEVREVFLDAAGRQRYIDGLARHQHHWRQACRQAGAVLTRVIAERLAAPETLQGLIAAEVLKVA